MNTHSIDLIGYRAQSSGNSAIYLGTAGSHGNEQLQVTQGEGWEGLTVQVIFHPCQVAVQLPANGLLDVPWEATEKPLTSTQGRIVFQGFDQDRLVNSSDLTYTVSDHSPATGRDEEPYTPGIVEGVLNQMAADKSDILQASQKAGQAKEAAAASAAEAAGSAANAQQSASAANTSAGQAAASASRAAGSAATAGEMLTQVQTAGQEAQQNVKDAETKALDKIAAAASALPAASKHVVWQSVTVKPDGSGYNLAALAPIEATIRPTVSGNPAICENSVAWELQGLKIYGKSIQNGTPSLENPVPIVSAEEIDLAVTGLNLFNPQLSETGKFQNTSVQEDNFAISNDAGSWISGLQLIQSGIKYCISKKCSGGAYYDNLKQPIKNVTVSPMASEFIPPQNACYVCLNFKISEIAFNSVGMYMDKLPEREMEYVGENLTFPVPTGLPGIPVNSGGNYTDSTGQQWVSDVMDFAAGTKTQNCLAEILSGTPNFKETDDLPGRYVWYDCLKHTYKTGSYLSLATFAKFANYGDIVSGTNTFSVSQDDIYFSPATSTTAEKLNAQFAEWMGSDHPPVILAQLPTPIITPLSTEEIDAYQALQTYSGTTVVSAVEPVAGLDVQYVTDSNKYCESLDRRLAALESAQNAK